MNVLPHSPAARSALVSLALLISSSPVFANYQEVGGSVRIEAEAYHASAVQDEHQWETLCSAGNAGYLRDAAVVALPEDQVRYDFGNPPSSSLNPLTHAARLDYVVNFTTTGQYYVWVRGWGVGPEGRDGFSNSIHFGVDYSLSNGSGTEVLSRVSFHNSPSPDYRWAIMREAPATPDEDALMPPRPVTISTAGQHTLSIWMRESGVYIDQIYLTVVDPGWDINTGTYAFNPAAGQTSDSVNPTAIGSALPVVAAPTISPNGGEYFGSADVTFDTCTGQATSAVPTIYYTTDGSTPSASNGTPVNRGVTVPNLVSSNVTVRAMATATSHQPSKVTSATFVAGTSGLDQNFNGGSGGFGYVDDAFRGTSQPGYANGAYSSTGGFSGGGLQLTLGGVDNATVTNMSGGWSRTFGVSTSGVVSVQFRYRLNIGGTYEAGECGQALASVDGVLRGLGGHDYLAQLCGDTPQSNVVKDTGWQQASLSISLTAGQHVLVLGGYNSQKTAANEFMTVSFDDVHIVEMGGSTVTVPNVVGLTQSAAQTAITGASLAVGTISTQSSATVPSGNVISQSPAGGASAAVGSAVALTVSTGPAAGSPILSTNFDSGAAGFAYADDRFRGTSQPTYASGAFSASGGFSQGGLTVTLGGINNTAIAGMSGGWSRTFTTATTSQVRVTLRYRLNLGFTYEAHECSQALVALDGLLLGTAGQDYLAQLCGDTPQSTVVKDSGWQQVSVQTTLAAGTHTLTLGGYNNEKSAFNEITTVSFDDVTVEYASGGSPPPILSASFDSGAGSFAYADNGFRGTAQPSYASGAFDASGGYSQGGVRVNLGGVDNVTIVGMSGRWSRTFNLAAASLVTVQLRYRLRLEGTYEAEECGQALVSVDGVLLGAGVGQDYLAELCGSSPQNNVVKDSGWQQVNLPVSLAAGSHTLAIGAYNNQKTTANETMAVWFDDVTVLPPP